VDPGRPSGSSPHRFLCGGFWSVNTIAVCISRDNGAVSSFRECGLPCGLRGALCTLHPCRSVCTSFTGATLGRSGWLDLAPQGLAPCKKRQASLGALTPAVSGGPQAPTPAWAKAAAGGRPLHCFVRPRTGKSVLTRPRAPPGAQDRRPRAAGGALLGGLSWTFVVLGVLLSWGVAVLACPCLGMVCLGMVCLGGSPVLACPYREVADVLRCLGVSLTPAGPNARGEPPRPGRHPHGTTLPLARSAPLRCSALV